MRSSGLLKECQGWRIKLMIIMELLPNVTTNPTNIKKIAPIKCTGEFKSFLSFNANVAGSIIEIVPRPKLPHKPNKSAKSVTKVSKHMTMIIPTRDINERRLANKNLQMGLFLFLSITSINFFFPSVEFGFSPVKRISINASKLFTTGTLIKG